MGWTQLWFGGERMNDVLDGERRYGRVFIVRRLNDYWHPILKNNFYMVRYRPPLPTSSGEAVLGTGTV